MTQQIQILENISLKTLNTFGIDASTRYFSAIDSTESLQTLLASPRWQSEKKLILGSGSNILLTQNFDGLVIKNNIQGITIEKESDEHVWLKVGAGVSWHQLVLHSIEQNYQGIENLSLIPGTVGAAPIQNIGAYGTELKEVFASLDAIKLDDRSIHLFKNNDCQFSYRQSIFKTTHKNQFAITHVTLRLNKNPRLNTSYAPLKAALSNMSITQPSIKTISDAVIHIRQSKLPDPAKIGNAGSFFKNPIISHQQFEHLKQQHPAIPHFPATDQAIKIPAAWLIEQCGFKGKNFGHVGVHERQALVLINHGNGSGQEIKSLSEDIQNAVKERFAITLNPEVNFI